MSIQQDVFNSPNHLRFGNIFGTFLVWLVLTAFINNNFTTYGFGVVFIALLPLAIGFLWWLQRSVSRASVRVTPQSITVMRGKKEHRTVAWSNAYLAELTMSGKGIDIYDEFGSLKLQTPENIERFEQLKELITSQLAERHAQKPPTEYFQQRNTTTAFVGWFVGMSLGFAIMAAEHYGENLNFEGFISQSIGFLMFVGVVAFLLLLSMLRKAKRLVFHNDHIEIRSSLRATRIPYSNIQGAELVPNPWAPVTSNRKFLKIHHTGFFRTFTVRGFELNSEQLLARLQERAGLPQP